MTHIDCASHRTIAASFSTRSRRYYVAAKIATDPVYAATAAIIAGSSLPLLDIGCGIGLLGQYLHACGHVRPYSGLDHDERKIDTGRRAVQRAGLDAVMTLHHADVAELLAPLENAGLDVQIKPLHGRTPFNGYLIVAQAHR